LASGVRRGGGVLGDLGVDVAGPPMSRVAPGPRFPPAAPAPRGRSRPPFAARCRLAPAGPPPRPAPRASQSCHLLSNFNSPPLPLGRPALPFSCLSGGPRPGLFSPRPTWFRAPRPCLAARGPTPAALFERALRVLARAIAVSPLVAAYNAVGAVHAAFRWLVSSRCLRSTLTVPVRAVVSLGLPLACGLGGRGSIASSENVHTTQSDTQARTHSGVLLFLGFL